MDFIDRVITSGQVPAGGASAACTLCIGLALLCQVVIKETGRTCHTPEMERNLSTVRKEINRLLEDVRRLIEKDSETFQRFSSARKNPDPAETRRSFMAVVAVSMEVMEKCEKGFQWIDRLMGIVPGGMVTHLKAAAEIIHGAFLATDHVVRDNIGRIRVERKRAAYLARLDESRQACKLFHGRLMGRLENIQAAAGMCRPGHSAGK